MLSKEDMQAFMDEVVTTRNERDKLRDEIKRLMLERAEMARKQRDDILREVRHLLWEAKNGHYATAEDSVYVWEVVRNECDRLLGGDGDDAE